MVETKANKKFLKYGGIFLIVIILVVIAVIYGTTTKNKKSVEGKVTDFETCSQKYPILQTYPEICKTPDGKSFTKKY